MNQTETEALIEALKQLADHPAFHVFLEELRQRRSDIILRAEVDEVMRDHPMLIGCVQYSKCLGEIIELGESQF